ncbi:NAD(P)/FAD-dependent oxidoreductase [Piscinibacter terrae]|uniref:NAD(P)/FAD-dependent oxidoreductase n=1 Tax=Piscinibacter terrae TaxID=2496871 RepID=A0A3N7HXN1_9BURK|nr:NAD(P)/FAD-dependent oxidoreductase [Albitalea terrae]RQP25821.1 NAD(P)/FAD-dependent oxidoreductase [Albitalea terrae]
MDRVDALVIGAGVVGLATGRALAQRGLDTIVLEQADAIGTSTSSRNSEVIHAGIYYPSGSLKARLCVNGRDQLYAFCESHGVAHRRCGKLIVASGEAQVGKLGEIERQAAANGVHDLQRLSGEEARAMEPVLSADAALLSPSTGIVDSHGLMLALQGDLEAAGGVLAVMSPVLGIDASGGELVVRVGGESPTELSARIVVNAAGLWAPSLAARTRGLDVRHVPTPRFAKGNYFSLSGRSPFSRLIYPMPEAGGLGVHLTLDLAGQARFGPDVQWLDIDRPEDIDYRVDATRGDAFYAAIRSYWPALPDGALQAAYSGVRPKLDGTTDFIIQGPRAHGVPGLVHLLGIESPGLTSCLAIADEVARTLEE